MSDIQELGMLDDVPTVYVNQLSLPHTPGVKAPPGTNFWTAVTREQVAANPDIAAQQINTLKGQLQTQIEKNLTLLKRLNEVLSQRK